MLFIGITGGVGAGKSAVLSYIKDNYSSRVMLSDDIAHELMMPGTDCYKELAGILKGQDVYMPDGRFDNIKLAAVLFNNDQIRTDLNCIVHPAVKAYVREAAGEERAKGELDILIVEAALLIEEGYGSICDELWYIYASEESRRERLKQNRGYSDEKTDSILKSQLDEAAFRAACSEIIDNNGSRESTAWQVRRLLESRGIRPVL